MQCQWSMPQHVYGFYTAYAGKCLWKTCTKSPTFHTHTVHGYAGELGPRG